MSAPQCPAALDAFVLTEGVACVALFNRATMDVIHHAGGSDLEEALHGAFHLAERLSVDDPNMRSHHANWTVYVRAASRTSVVAIVRPASKVSKSINRSLQRILKRAEKDMGPMKTTGLVVVDG